MPSEAKRHLEAHRDRLEPNPKGREGGGWEGRKPGPYLWYELQDPVGYWREFEKPEIMYQEIQFHPCYTLDRCSMLANNKVFFIAGDDLFLLGVLNSPLMWWHNRRYLPPMKDEALSPAGFKMEGLPIARPTDEIREAVGTAVQRLLDVTGERLSGRRAVMDWLRLEFGIEKPNQKLQDLTALDDSGLVTEVKKLRGKRNPLSVADVRRLKEEHTRSIAPLQRVAGEARQLERRVAEWVNAAYGLTPEEVSLVWQTAPPRMPGEPPKAQ